MRITCVAAMLAALSAAPAAAQYTGPRQIQPTDSAVWGEVGLFAGSDRVGATDVDTTFFRTLLRAYFGVGSLELAFAWGFAFGSFDALTADDTAFRFGNPYAALHFKLEKRDFVLRIGGGLALPVATIDDDASLEEAFSQSLALQGAAAIGGLWDAWLWTADRFSIVAPSFRMDGRGSDFVWAVEAALGVLIDTSDADRDAEVVIQGAVEGGARLGRSFVLGGRFQTVLWPTVDDDLDEDLTQLAFGPFIRVEGESGFGYLRMTINLDEPYGFAFDDDGIWGLHAGGGARF